MGWHGWESLIAQPGPSRNAKTKFRQDFQRRAGPLPDAAKVSGMNRTWHLLPGFVVLIAGLALIVHGPIPQLPRYHDFADPRAVLGIPHGWNVLSSLAFLAVGAWACLAARGHRNVPEARARNLFFAMLLLTAAGSAWYHWAPDNARLVFDRLPIALACACLLAAAHTRLHGERIPGLLGVLLAVAVATVAWWYWSESRGRGDLRPYLLLQGAPLVLVPLWQWLQRAPRAERIDFGLAIALYALAKAFELHDAEVMEATGFVSGHTAKHLLAALAAVFVARSFLGRPRRGGAP